MSALHAAFWRYARPHRGPAAAILALMLVDIGCNVLAPWPLKLMVDSVLAGAPLPAGFGWLGSLPGAGGPAGLVAWLAGATLAVYLSRQVAIFLRRLVEARTGARMKVALAGDVMERLLARPLAFHRAQRTGDLTRRLTADTDFPKLLLTGVALPGLTAAGTLAAMAVVLVSLDPLLAAVAALAALPLPFLIRFFAPGMSERAWRQAKAEGEIMALAEQTLTALPVVQAFGREPHERTRFRGLSTRAIGATILSTGAQIRMGLAVGVTMAAGSATVLLFGGLGAAGGSMTVGSLVVFLAYLRAVYEPMEGLANLSTAHAGAAGKARRILPLLDPDADPVESPGARPFARGRAGAGHSIDFEDVRFEYRPGTPVLDGIDLSIAAGETVALTGPTGAGKTTLASLVPRFADPGRGRVLLAGQDVRSLTLASVRAQVSVVLQEPYLLPLSVAENIAYGRPHASREEITAAGRAASAHAFIRALPDGYDTVIGERGATLSGGQRQRIAIARALLRDAPVLILDEPTSALDAETEAAVLQALDRQRRRRTVLIITHRPAVIRAADRVIEVAGGRARLVPPPTAATALSGTW